MTAVILRPMTAVLATTLFLGSDGFPVTPLTIAAVVAAYVIANRLTATPTGPDQHLQPDGGQPPGPPSMPPPRAAEPGAEEPSVEASRRPGADREASP